MTNPVRRGRPPKVDLDAIATAVLEVGFESATMRRVADHLGIGVSTLYHHVNSREDLIRVAAARVLTGMTLPDHSDVPWPQWLRAFAFYIRDSLGGQPELLAQFTAGQLEDIQQLVVIGGALEVLCDYGFTPDDAMASWEAMSAVALGGAIEEVRERAKSAEGRAWPVRAMVAATEVDDLTVLRGFAGRGYVPNTDTAFDRRLDIVVAGIEACHAPSG